MSSSFSSVGDDNKYSVTGSATADGMGDAVCKRRYRRWVVISFMRSSYDNVVVVDVVVVSSFQSYELLVVLSSSSSSSSRWCRDACDKIRETGDELVVVVPPFPCDGCKMRCDAGGGTTLGDGFRDGCRRPRRDDDEVGMVVVWGVRSCRGCGCLPLVKIT